MWCMHHLIVTEIDPFFVLMEIRFNKNPFKRGNIRNLFNQLYRKYSEEVSVYGSPSVLMVCIQPNK